MFNQHQINEKQWKMLIADRDKTDWPSITFLPKLLPNQTIIVQPLLSFKNSPIHSLATWIDELLRPVVDRIASSTIVRHGNDFLRRFLNYTKQKYRFSSSTQFATLIIRNYTSTLSHENILDALGRFLVKHLTGNRLNNLTIIAIQTITEIFLRQTCFIYQNRIYQFERGSPNDVSFTETLNTIFYLEWQECLLHHPWMKQEFLVRYKDQLFCTFNGLHHDLNSILQKVQEHHVNVKFDHVIGQTVQFMNIHLENRQGHLYTRIHRDVSIEQPYLLPFVIGHARLIYVRYFRLALIRAVRYCTDVVDFDQERLYLELTMLSNGFPLSAVEHHCHRFFRRFQMTSLQTVLNQNVYDQFRLRLFQLLDDELVAFEQERTSNNNPPVYRFSYYYEWGPRQLFNRKFRELWTQYVHPYPFLPGDAGRIHLQTKHIHSLHALLAQEKSI